MRVPVVPLVVLCLLALPLMSAQREDVSFEGAAHAFVETGYLSPGGTLLDTRPSAEQEVDEVLHLGPYGRLKATQWIISALHGGRDPINRRAFYFSEVTAGYGYDITVSDSVDIVNDLCIVWDSPLGFKHYSSEEVGWWFTHSIENKVCVPYLTSIGLFSPEQWLYVAGGVRRTFDLCETLKLTPSIETAWGDSDCFAYNYGVSPGNRFLGGAFMTITPGIRLDWQFAEAWTLWFRFREFITINSQAREVVRSQSEYFAKTEASIVSLGLSYAF